MLSTQESDIDICSEIKVKNEKKVLQYNTYNLYIFM